MGRRKVELKKIENNTYRHISFSKRKTGLLKKAYELSTMCDTEVGLILFSPAGKLFLYEGKKRIEDILQQYMDLPERQRGRVHNPELIRGIIAQFALEWSIYKKEKLGYTSSRMNMESLVQGLMNDISTCGSQLEQVKKQLMCLIESPSLVQESAEAGKHEETLEGMLRLLRMRKQVIEENEQFYLQQGLAHGCPAAGGFEVGASSSYNDLSKRFPTAGGFELGASSSYNGLFKEFPTAGRFDVGASSSYNNFNNPPQQNFFDGDIHENQPILGGNFNPPTQPQPPNFLPIPMHSALDFGFQSFSNETLNYDGNLPPPQTGFEEMSVDRGPINGPSPFDEFIDPQPELELADVNFPPDVNASNLPNDQASASSNAGQSNVGDSPLCSFGACQHSECGLPFSF